MQLDHLSHLAVFTSVARHNSFRKAATELGLSASAVSYAIRTLEEHLGVSLFNRTTRSVALSDAGRRLSERLQPALSNVSDALEEMNNFRATPTGTLRINSSRVATQLLIAPLMQRFLAAYPEIHLDVASDDGLVDIVGTGFDVGIRYEEAVPEDMVAVSIGSVRRFAVVGSPAYFERHTVPRHPEELYQHDCIRYRFPSGLIYKWELAKDDVQLEMDVKGPLTVGEADLAVRAAVDGIGLVFTLEDNVALLMKEKKLVRVLEDWCPRFPGFMLYYPRQRRMSSALRAFIDMAHAFHVTT